MSERSERVSTTVSESAVPWREGLVAELGKLGWEIVGRVLDVAPPGTDTVSGARLLLDRTALLQAVIDCGKSLSHAAPDADPDAGVKSAAAASRFTRHYVSSVSAAAFVALARGVGLDLGADRCVKVVEDGVPRKHLLPESDEGIITCAERSPAWRVDGARSVATLDELRQYVWKRLYGDHIEPLFAAVSAETRATSRLLWSNAAEWVVYPADMAVVHFGLDEAQPFLEDARALLDAPTLPGIDGPNPLSGQIHWIPVDEPDFPLGLTTRRQCCSTYMLPARTGYLCGNCPFLPVEDRIPLVREMRDCGGLVGGPAQQRSIAIGRQKLGLARSARA